ncbi:MAG TPA: SH3 domain-containing protein [Terracidiphilus sp.]|nr:SH3 domain-containing protein [Terracidiphilus sp.]
MSHARRVLPVLAVLLALVITAVAGCDRFRPEPPEYVYVWARQMFLRDRVAVVSTRVAQVKNGERLEVIEHSRRFLNVKTADGKTGWIPESAVIDKKIYDGFEKLATDHKDDPVIASATLRNDYYLHLTPGRDTDRFYLLPENAKVQLLKRSSIPKANARATGTNEPPPLEDWWLVHDAQNHYGWMLASGFDVNAPFSIAQYSEGQRIVGAYILRRTHDDESSVPDHEVPEYVVALGPYKWGLPYDFDQIRVFTWNVKRHRYETAFRLRNIEGYLPVALSTEPATGGGTNPVFSFQIATTPNAAIDPATGVSKPAKPRTISYALRQTVVRRTGADQAPLPTSRDLTEKSAVKAKSKSRR